MLWAAHTVLLALLAVGDAPPVPGGCSAPAAEHQNQPGCFLSAELAIDAAPRDIYWHIYQAPDIGAAKLEAGRHPRSVALVAHGSAWVYVLGSKDETSSVGKHVATIGPIDLPAGSAVSMRFIESLFPAGMQTRVHAHPGVEAFYVVEGEQCMETPSDHARVKAGKSYLVPIGPHVQTSPKGRRNLALVVVPAGKPWMTLESGWTPSDFCAR
jgi:mannose-6-phosphate isomerase-like protein (cupin superfamily)